METSAIAPAVEELAPSVFRIVLPLPWSTDHINVYVVRYGTHCTLIDTGILSDECLAALESGLKYLGIGFPQIAQIIVTHSHVDHVGLAGRIQELSGGWLILHQVEADLLEQRYFSADTPTAAIESFLTRYGVSDRARGEIARSASWARAFVAPARPDIMVHGGEVIDVGESSLRVFWTPGHSRGHCCFYDVERKVLFAGDHILANVTPNVGRNPMQSEQPLLDYERSLDQLMQLNVGLTLPGHGPPIPDLSARCIQLLQSHQRRRERCLAAVQAGFETLESITPRVFGRGRPAFENRRAMLETLSHLEALVVEGRLQRVEESGQVHFVPAPAPIDLSKAPRR